MRRTCLWMAVISTGLIAIPAFGAQGGRDMSNDCFDVAAPMADATPCVEPGRRKSHHHDRRHQNASQTSSDTLVPHAATPSPIRDGTH
ncbi:hypothetical protein ACWGNZ_08410 [Sphingomonas zeae]